MGRINELAGMSVFGEEWCPNSNLFGSRELAERWAYEQSLAGRVLDLDEASDLATEAWSGLA